MKNHRIGVAISLALGATCLFGRMSFVASSGGYENPDPTQIQQLRTLWWSAYWIVPALIVGTLIPRRVVVVAAAVNLIGGLILLALEYPHNIPVGSYFSVPSDLFSMAADLATSMPFAILLSLIMKAAVRMLMARQTV
jgi:hypothetical protein